MSLGQHIDLTGDCTNRAVITTVNARLSVNNTLANNRLFQRLEEIFHVFRCRAAIDRELFNNRIPDFSHAIIARGLLCNSVGFAQRPFCFSLYSRL